MNAYQTPIKLDIPTDDRRASQLAFLCHFLEVFASADPLSRAAASQYGERLRDEGYDSDGVIRIAATILLAAIEHEIEDRTAFLDWSMIFAKGSSVTPDDSQDSGEERHDQTA